MMPLNNVVIIAAAGSRKTTFIVEEAIKNSSEKVLILTYTNENLTQLRNYIIEKNAFIPSHIVLQTWFTFLLQDCVRPYQSFVYDGKRVENIHFVSGKSFSFAGKANVEAYYFVNSNRIYNDKISDFACRCDAQSKGLVIKRLEKIYDHIYIDEVQDLAGHDFELLELFFNSTIAMTVVGDNRQATYVTNHSNRNKKFNGKNILFLFKAWEKIGLCTIQERNYCYRCNQKICDFADKLYPEMTKTISKNNETPGHEGIYLVNRNDINNYLIKFSPQVLRYKVSNDTEGLRAINFGMSKGQTFERVLIFPTAGIKQYLKTGNPSDVKDIAKFYVALTRARHSVAIVYEGEFIDPNVLNHSFVQ